MIKLTSDLENAPVIAQHLRQGAVVALPTETVYGLAISLDSAAALEKLIYLKRRAPDSGKIFTLVPASGQEVAKYANLNNFTENLIRRYFPGALTLVLPKNHEFHHPYYDHFQTIGVRIPCTTLFRELLSLSGPLMLTSANPRGGVPASCSAEVEKALPKVDVLVEGRAGGLPPSTVLDCTVKPASIVRSGPLDKKIEL